MPLFIGFVLKLIHDCQGGGEADEGDAVNDRYVQYLADRVPEGAQGEEGERRGGPCEGDDDEREGGVEEAERSAIG